MPFVYKYQYKWFILIYFLKSIRKVHECLGSRALYLSNNTINIDKIKLLVNFSIIQSIGKAMTWNVAKVNVTN